MYCTTTAQADLSSLTRVAATFAVRSASTPFVVRLTPVPLQAVFTVDMQWLAPGAGTVPLNDVQGMHGMQHVCARLCGGRRREWCGLSTSERCIVASVCLIPPFPSPLFCFCLWQLTRLRFFGWRMSCTLATTAAAATKMVVVVTRWWTAAWTFQSPTWRCVLTSSQIAADEARLRLEGEGGKERRRGRRKGWISSLLEKKVQPRTFTPSHTHARFHLLVSR